MLVPDFILKWGARLMSDKLHLQEGPYMPTKPWYTSKTIYACAVTGLIGIYMQLIAQGVHLPAIPPFVLTILGAMGVYARSVSNTTLSS